MHSIRWCLLVRTVGLSSSLQRLGYIFHLLWIPQNGWSSTPWMLWCLSYAMLAIVPLLELFDVSPSLVSVTNLWPLISYSFLFSQSGYLWYSYQLIFHPDLRVLSDVTWPCLTPLMQQSMPPFARLVSLCDQIWGGSIMCCTYALLWIDGTIVGCVLYSLISLLSLSWCWDCDTIWRGGTLQMAGWGLPKYSLAQPPQPFPVYHYVISVLSLL